MACSPGAPYESRGKELALLRIETVDQADRLAGTLYQSQGLVPADPVLRIVIRRMPQLLKLAEDFARNDGIVAELTAPAQTLEYLARAYVIEGAVDVSKGPPRSPRSHKLPRAELGQGME
jgi:hypothetical protein